MVYCSTIEAKRVTGISHIDAACRGSRKTAGGYHWEYVDDKTSKRKKVICIETQIIYESVTHASKETGIHNASISKACNGKQTSAGGYHWKFVE